MASFSPSIDVFISLQCSSMMNSTKILSDYLRKRGLTYWICNDMKGGDIFRTEITQAVERCKIFLPLLNQNWADSGECEFEYNHAIRLSLASKIRYPRVLPVAFEGLDWNHPRISPLASNYNFIVHKGPNLLSGPVEETLKLIGDTIEANLSQYESLLLDKSMENVKISSSTTSVDSNGNEIKLTKILVIGRTGDGKSTFCNRLSRHLGVMDTPFVESASTDSHTHDCRNCIGGNDNNWFNVIDTPGLLDTNGVKKG
eukprot:gene7459-10169_t